MKLSEVKKELKRRLREGQRLVDCYIFGDNNEYVMATTISKNHVVYKESYKLNESAEDPYTRVEYINLVDCM